MKQINRDCHPNARFMDYVKFCAAVEPKCGGRDLDNQARELDKAWREKRPPRKFGAGDTASLAAGGAAERAFGVSCDMMQEAEEVCCIKICTQAGTIGDRCVTPHVYHFLLFHGLNSSPSSGPVHSVERSVVLALPWYSTSLPF